MQKDTMDLGCLDLGCISVSEKENTDPGINSNEKDRSPVESTSVTRSGKNKLLKENGQSTNILSRSIKKPPRRKISPLNWFPRKKVDSYLSRKIKMLQEVDGMNSTLDETLCDANPHYSKVLREKIAARDAAHKAMEARKAALVEASWCRILRAARIQSKEAEEVSLRAEKAAAEAFEAASALGVIMYDKPNCPRKPSKVVTSSINCGGFFTHTVTASFETAFDMDREVAAAVKTAFIRLANCSSFSKDEVKDLLHKISQNPDSAENNHLELSSEYDSESGSDFETIPEKNDAADVDLDSLKAIVRSKRRQSIEKLTREKLVDMMFERLKCLQEEELSSLATIVATCGLNAALAKAEGRSTTIVHNTSTVDTSRRMSSSAFGRNYARKESDIPSLDKFLVKHVSKLEKEMQEAKSSRSSSARVGNHENANEMNDGNVTSDETEKLHEIHLSTPRLNSEDGKKNDGAEGKLEASDKSDIHANVCEIDDLGSVLIKHSSRLEREIEEIKRNQEKAKEPRRVKDGFSTQTTTNAEIPSLDKFLVKHVSRLEREVQEAKLRRENSEGTKKLLEKENMKPGESGSEGTKDSLENILIKPVHRLDREKQAWSSKSSYAYQKHQKKQDKYITENCESLDKVLVKHVSTLEKEKMRLKSQDEYHPKAKTTHLQTDEHGSLDQIFVKHKSRLEREKTVAASQPAEEVKVSVSRREARERELQEAWGGLSLGNSIRPHLSRLERDKAAWIKAEEEERKKAMNL